MKKDEGERTMSDESGCPHSQHIPCYACLRAEVAWLQAERLGRAKDFAVCNEQREQAEQRAATAEAALATARANADKAIAYARLVMRVDAIPVLVAILSPPAAGSAAEGAKACAGYDPENSSMGRCKRCGRQPHRHAANGSERKTDQGPCPAMAGTTCCTGRFGHPGPHAAPHAGLIWK